jgi:hypothetical protein
VIKNAVLHPIGEQPLLADLLVPPRASDISLLCTNLRMIDGKRPTAIDDPSSLFIIPMSTIRFIEAPGQAIEAVIHEQREDSPAAPRESRVAGGNGHSIPLGPPGTALVALPGGELNGLLPDDGPAGEPDEPDEDLLKRIRDL